VLKSLLWLRRENLNRGHIYVRPAGAHGLSLVDDLKADALARMKAEGFEPAAVVETSPGNFQAWLKHGETLDEAVTTRAAKLLAERYGGDLGSGAPTGTISGGWRGSPTLSRIGAWHRGYSHLRGWSRPAGRFTVGRRRLSRKSERRWPVKLRWLAVVSRTR
jgi:hypothetical protein